MAMRWIFAFLLAAATGHAQRLAISQARVDLPAFTLFLDAAGPDGAPLAVTGPAALKATLGSHRLSVAEVKAFDAAQSGIAYIVLVDVSKSLGPREFGEVRDALGVMAGQMGPRDRMAVIRFADRPEMVADFTSDQAALRAAFGAMERTGEHTALHLALRQAVELGKRLDPQLPARRAAVVLTDGKDEGSGITIDDVLGDVRDNRLPFYTVGFSRLPGAERETYFDLLKRLALDSGGGFFEAANGDRIAKAYAETRSAISQVLEARLTCADCTGDGSAQRLAVTLDSGGRVLTDAIDLRVAPGAAVERAPVPAPRKPAVPVWAYAAGGGVAVLLAAIVFAARRKRGQTDAPAAAAAPAVAAGVAAEPAPKAAVRLEFVVVRGDRPGASYQLALGGRATIGTAADSDLRLASESTVAAHQFELECVLDRIVIRNLAAGQSTLLNGVPVRAQHLISSGDLISAGSTDLRVVVGG